MPTSDLAERLHRLLRCLADPHRSYSPANIDSALICEASVLHAKQIEALGTEYNNLEEAIYNLEQANNDRESRVRRLEEQANTSSDHEARLNLLEKQLEGPLPVMDPTAEDSMPRSLQDAKSNITEFLR